MIMLLLLLIAFVGGSLENFFNIKDNAVKQKVNVRHLFSALNKSRKKKISLPSSTQNNNDSNPVFSLEWGKKILIYVSFPVIFIWLLMTSFKASRWKPDSANELLTDFSWLNNWPKWLDIPLMKWINDGFKVFNEEYGIYFEIVNNFLLGAILSLKKFLVMLPWPLVIALVVVIVFFSSGRKLGTTVFVGICTFFIGFLHPKFWDKAIETTSIMLIGILICVIFGIPLGIVMSRSRKVRNAILPVLDLMQTIPSFCYLIPGIMLFGLGAVPAIIATVIYAIPPLVRLTDLGIRLVDIEVIEAAEAFGASRRQKLLGVQLPLALPNIMQGINQCTMMALAMVVIASMIGTRGLGDEVLLGLQQLNVGKATEAGLAIVLLAIVLDRITQAYGEKIQDRNKPLDKFNEKAKKKKAANKQVTEESTKDGMEAAVKTN